MLWRYTSVEFVALEELRIPKAKSLHDERTVLWKSEEDSQKTKENKENKENKEEKRPKNLMNNVQEDENKKEKNTAEVREEKTKEKSKLSDGIEDNTENKEIGKNKEKRGLKMEDNCGKNDVQQKKNNLKETEVDIKECINKRNNINNVNFRNNKIVADGKGNFEESKKGEKKSEEKIKECKEEISEYNSEINIHQKKSVLSSESSSVEEKNPDWVSGICLF